MSFLWSCPGCGRNMLSTDPIVVPVRCACGHDDFSADNVTVSDAEPPSAPSLIVQSVHYATAAMRWAAAGWPQRSDREILKIIDEHCAAGCQYYVDQRCTHAMCGCQVRTPDEERATLLGRWVSGALLNKVRMATEHCPEGRW